MTYDKHDELMAELKELVESLDRAVTLLHEEVSELRLQRLIDQGHWL